MFKLLAGMLIGALGLWIYGKYNTPAAPVVKKRLGQVLGFILVTAMVVLGWRASNETPAVTGGQTVEKYGITWEPFDTGRIIDLRSQGKTIFIDFTASW